MKMGAIWKKNYRLVGLLLGLSEGSTSLDWFNNVLDIAAIVIGIWLIILVAILAWSYISSVVGNRVLGLGRRLLVNNRSGIVGVRTRSLELSRIGLLLWLDMLGLLVWVRKELANRLSELLGSVAASTRVSRISDISIILTAVIAHCSGLYTKFYI